MASNTTVPPRAELLESLRSSGVEVTRSVRSIPAADFERGRYENGWNARQILAHIASIEWTYARLVDVARQARSVPLPSDEGNIEPAHRAPRSDNLSYNERQVAKRADASIAELIEEFERNRAATITAIEEADDETLAVSVRSAFGYEGSLAQVIHLVAVDHTLVHVRDIVEG
jgi:restriction endonuclease Mrr